MIAFLRGLVIDNDADTIIVDVSGVGYEVKASVRAHQIARTGQEVALYTYFHVREDAHVLFGFVDAEERNMFRTLLSVSGVGPKTALTIVSAFSPVDIIRAVQAEDAAALKAPGVGPKIVKKIILELKGVLVSDKSDQRKGSKTGGSTKTDIIAALEQLGYTPQEIRVMLDDVNWQDMTLEEAIRAVLKKS